MFFEYLTTAYPQWLTGTTESDAVDDELKRTFCKFFLIQAEKDHDNEREISKLKAEFDKLEQEWSSLTQNDSPLTIIEKQVNCLVQDNSKFKAYVDQLEAKKISLQETVLSLEQDLQQAGFFIFN
jgi:SMC interacting uncharacterized protein involved in chromosome segregation